MKNIHKNGRRRRNADVDIDIGMESGVQYVCIYVCLSSGFFFFSSSSSSLLFMLFLLDLPPPLRQLIAITHLRHINANHGLAQPFADLRQDGRVLVVRDSLDDGLGALAGISGLEDAGADEDAVAAQLHHERGVGGRGNTTRSEVDDGQAALLGRFAQQLVRAAQLAGVRAQLSLRVRRREQDAPRARDLLVDGAHVLDGLDDVARAGLAFCPDHGGAFGDAAQGFAQVAAAADERDLEVRLLDVVAVVSRGEDFGFVDVVDSDGFEDLIASKSMKISG